MDLTVSDRHRHTHQLILSFFFFAFPDVPSNVEVKVQKTSPAGWYTFIDHFVSPTDLANSVVVIVVKKSHYTSCNVIIFD